MNSLASSRRWTLGMAFVIAILSALVILAFAPRASAAPADLDKATLGQWCLDRQANPPAPLTERADDWLADCVALFAGGLEPQLENDCMAEGPHLCGFPDATNTGAHGTLTPVTDTVVLTENQTLENTVVTGCIWVTGNNVTIRNVKIIRTNSDNDCSYAGIDLEFTGVDAGVEIQDVEIDLSGLPDGATYMDRFGQRTVTGSGFTMDRVWIHGGSDCVHYGSDVVIQNSFCDLSLYTGLDDPHLDGFQSAGGDGVEILHNTVVNPNNQTSAIINGTSGGDQINVKINGNLLKGGGWTVYCNAHQTEPVPTIEFKNNRIVEGAGEFGETTDCTDLDPEDRTGNVDDVTGNPLTLS